MSASKGHSPLLFTYSFQVKIRLKISFGYLRSGFKAIDREQEERKCVITMTSYVCESHHGLRTQTARTKIYKHLAHYRAQ